MSHTFKVLLNKKQVPSSQDILSWCQSFGYCVEFESEWDFYQDLGYLPVKIDGEESGFDLEVGGISKHDKSLASKAGYKGLNTELLITIYGDWLELKVASIVGLALTVLSEGCLTDEDGEYLGSDDAKQWALENINSSQQGTKGSDKRDMSNDVQRELELIVGAEINGFVTDEQRLGISLSSGHSLSSLAWSISTDAVSINAVNYAKARAEQLKLLETSQGEITDSVRKQLTALEEELYKAGEVDEELMTRAKLLLGKWAGKVSVTSASYTSNQSIEIMLSNHVAIVFYCYGDLMLAITLTTPSGAIKIDA
ncbi:hypothetical protein [Pleionea sp. CnH1-48]|uniref:hypothetical protein n=1 Tax=Pleionea sp. CnH1-48 TaxID=2954494 RepID=UPI002096ACA7|nr:hypothetical protein [Pleionea sp. CnH1-48]MCO7225066.1 hypothetical protein [Pleionea sp. CnH1-48]